MEVADFLAKMVLEGEPLWQGSQLGEAIRDQHQVRSRYRRLQDRKVSDIGSGPTVDPSLGCVGQT